MVEEIFYIYIFLDKARRTLTIFFSLCAKLNLLNEANNKYSSPSYFQIESKNSAFLNAGLLGVDYLVDISKGGVLRRSIKVNPAWAKGGVKSCRQRRDRNSAVSINGIIHFSIIHFSK